jgi:hypothetical protein
MATLSALQWRCYMRSRMGVFRFCCLCLVLGFCLRTIGADAAENVSAPAKAGATKTQLDSTAKKLEFEIEKLEQEVRGLRETNEVFDKQTRWWSTWLGALGGVLGAAIALLSAALLGLRLNATQNRKLEQERVLGREKHNMELFQNLGAENLRVQLAAASVLLQRLESFRPERLTPAEQLEKHTIIQVLIAVTKKNEREDSEPEERPRLTYGTLQVTKKNSAGSSIHPALAKLIADNLVKAIGAMPGDDTYERARPSPLEAFEFQKVQFPNAWWEGVDARGVDFFRADLSKAGLKKAHFEGAVLYEANLQGSVLREAHLHKTDLRKADLRKADLRKADLSGAQLEEALFDGAKVAGAKLKDATFGKSPTGIVDMSLQADASHMLPVEEWIKQTHSGTSASAAA